MKNFTRSHEHKTAAERRVRVQIVSLWRALNDLLGSYPLEDCPTHDIELEALLSQHPVVLTYKNRMRTAEGKR